MSSIENSRSSDEPKKYGEGSQVLKACKPASLVEYQLARKGGNAEASVAGDRMIEQEKIFKCCNY